MICSHCGAKIDRGQVYCPNCGKMQQLVPDYYEAEEEILNDADPDIIQENTARSSAVPKNRAEKAAGRRRKRIIVICAVSVCVLAAVIIGMLFYRSTRNNSYDVQMQLAQEALDDGNYGKAEKHASRALTLNGSSTDARLLLYAARCGNGNADLTLLEEVLELDDENTQAYQLLIEYYAGQDDYDTLLSMAYDAPNDEILALFDGYLTQMPVFSPEAGTYEHVTEVTISSDDTVYYTTDGSVPDTGSDIYEDGITLSEGTWTISAIAVDASGRSSLVSTAVYVIDPEVPDSVTISPAGGTYTESVSITLSAQDGCTIYYAWDTTDADSITNEYTGALLIPEGNHILSAVAVSEDGIMSAVSSRSFIYLPDDSQNTEE